MVDPGRAYLYNPPKEGQGPAESEPSTPTLKMNALPRMSSSAGSTDWQAAVGNMENAKLALDTLKTLINDAVFLDEEAFTNSNTLQLYQQRIQVNERSAAMARLSCKCIRCITATCIVNLTPACNDSLQPRIHPDQCAAASLSSPCIHQGAAASHTNPHPILPHA